MNIYFVSETQFSCSGKVSGFLKKKFHLIYITLLEGTNAVFVNHWQLRIPINHKKVLINQSENRMHAARCHVCLQENKRFCHVT